MSYEIVKSITIKKGKVFARMSSNNVYPRDFRSREHKHLTQILTEEGLMGLYTFLVEGGVEGSIDFNENVNKIVKQLNYVVKNLYNDKQFQNKTNKEKEIIQKIWSAKDGSKEKLELNEYIELKVKECFDTKIKIPISIKKELDNVLEMYEENLENDENDIFSGTQDSYANEMLAQNIYDVLNKENVEKIMSLNNNLYILLELDFANKSYNEVLEDITEKLAEKIEINIENLSKFINVVQEEKEVEQSIE